MQLQKLINILLKDFADLSLRKQYVRSFGVPSHFRFRYWMHEAEGDLVKTTTYEACVKLGALPHTIQTGAEGEISRDVPRTFVDHPLFSLSDGVGQRLLFNTLTALAVRYPHVGYCQGMNFVVAVMLIAALQSKGIDPCSLNIRLTKDMETRIGRAVFSLMAAFLEKFDMKELWRPCVPQLKLRIYQFQRLLSQKLPVLQAHFVRIGLTADIFASQWFLTLLSYNLPLEVLLHVWDVLVMDGWKTVFRVGISMLKLFEGKLLLMGLEELSSVFRHNKLVLSTPLLLQESFFKTKISTRSLNELENEYFDIVLKSRLADGLTNKMALHTSPEKRILRHVNEEMNRFNRGSSRNDVVVFRSRIELAEKERTFANKRFQVALRNYDNIKKERDNFHKEKTRLSRRLETLETNTYKYHRIKDNLRYMLEQAPNLEKRYNELLWELTQAQMQLEEGKCICVSFVRV